MWPDCTPAAAGPAFEGRGADDANGSDRIATLAKLLEEHVVDETGLLQEPWFTSGIDVALEGKRKTVRLTQKDIRDIQLAKAAVRTGIHFLAGRAGLNSYEQIGRVFIAGGMGFYLDRQAAVRIGLLPSALKGKMQAAGNTSLAGAALAARGDGKRHICTDAQTRGSLATWMTEINAPAADAFHMADQPEFEEVYVGYMNFPMKQENGKGSEK